VVEPEAATATATAEEVPAISVEGETEEVSAADREDDAKKSRVKDSGTTLHAGDSSDEDEHDRFEASSVASSAFSSAPGHTAAPSTKAQKGLDRAKGLVVEASRELRVKLYVGQVSVMFPPPPSLPPPECGRTHCLRKGVHWLDVVHPVLPHAPTPILDLKYVIENQSHLSLDPKRPRLPSWPGDRHP
jgi:hypothetical protein